MERGPALSPASLWTIFAAAGVFSAALDYCFVPGGFLTVDPPFEAAFSRFP